MSSRKNSKKYSNIQKNKNISLLVSSDSPKKSATFLGKALTINTGDEKEEYYKKMHMKNCDMPQFILGDEIILIIFEIEEMNGVDLIIISAGCIFINHELKFEKEKKTIELNVMAFTKMINVAYKYFSQKKEGHIVGISSIAALRGGYDAPAYHASKAFVSNYMEGLRIKAKKSKSSILITDIKPGYIDTDMAVKENLFWVAEPKKASLQIYNAIYKKKDYAYIPKRWRLIAWFIKIVPDFIYKRF